MAEVKLLTKIQSFEDVQKSLQEIEVNLNKLSNAVNSITEKRAEDSKGKPGDLQMTVNFNKTYDLEGKTEDGWVKLATKDTFDTGWFTAIEDRVFQFRHNIEIDPEELLRTDMFIKRNDNGQITHFNCGYHPMGHAQTEDRVLNGSTGANVNNDDLCVSYTSTHLFFHLDMDNCQRGIVFSPINITDTDAFGEEADITSWYDEGGATFCGENEASGSVVEIYDACQFKVIATKVLV